MNEALIIEKLDAILAKLAPSSIGDAAVLPPDVPELALAQIDPATINGQDVQKDGSTWTLDQGRPVGLIYGYISPAKAPLTWGRMVSAFGGDEARLRAIIESNGALARYKVHPEAVLHQGANSFFLLSHLLSNPLPPASPTV